MAVYVLAQLKFTDRPAYDRYQARFAEVFAKFAWRVLAGDEHPLVVEGDWRWTKVVLLSFPDNQSFWAWHESAEYQEIARDRRIGAEALILLVQGFAQRVPNLGSEGVDAAAFR